MSQTVALGQAHRAGSRTVLTAVGPASGEGAIGNAAGQAGLGINGGMTKRQGPKPEVGAPVNGCNIVVGVEDVIGLNSPVLSDGTVAMGAGAEA